MSIRTHHPRPVYIIEKTNRRNSPWRIIHFASPDEAVGTIIDHKESRKQALVCAGLLAGRKADVVVWRGL